MMPNSVIRADDVQRAVDDTDASNDCGSRLRADTTVAVIDGHGNGVDATGRIRVTTQVLHQAVVEREVPSDRAVVRAGLG